MGIMEVLEVGMSEEAEMEISWVEFCSFFNKGPTC